MLRKVNVAKPRLIAARAGEESTKRGGIAANGLLSTLLSEAALLTTTLLISLPQITQITQRASRFALAGGVAECRGANFELRGSSLFHLSSFIFQLLSEAALQTTELLKRNHRFLRLNRFINTKTGTTIRKATPNS